MISALTKTTPTPVAASPTAAMLNTALLAAASSTANMHSPPVAAGTPRPFSSFTSPLKLLHTSFSNVPDIDATLIHECPTSENEAGLRAIIVRSQADAFDLQLFGQLPQDGSPGGEGSSSSSSSNVFLQVAERGHSFVQFSQAKKSIRLSLPAYICVLEFFASSDWTRIESKIKYQITLMRDKTSSIPIETGLGYVSHGCCQYEACFENGLSVKARSDSKDASSRIFAWIEFQSQSLELDPRAVAVLAKNLPFLTKLLAEGPPAKRLRQL